MTEQLVDAGSGSHVERGTSRPGGAGRDAAVVLGIFVVLGVVAGVVWWLLVDPATFTKLRGGATMDEQQLSRLFNADGWYTVVGAVGGVTAGVLLTWWRARDYLLTTVLVAVGALVAGGIAALVGHLLGPGNADAALASAPVGAHVPVPLAVTGWPPTARGSGWVFYLVWPTAALIGALMVLWSTPRDGEQ